MAKMTRPIRQLDEDVWTLAKRRCEHIFDNFDNVIVSFSGGKDSTATLNVALEVAHSHERFARHLPLRTVFYDEEAIPDETVQYVERVRARDDVALEWYCLPTKQRNACSRKSPWWWTWAPEAEHLWTRRPPEWAIMQLDGFVMDPPEARGAIPDINGLLCKRESGTTAMMLGIRAQESLTRRRAVTRKNNGENYLIPYDIGRGYAFTKAYPIYDWTTEDVWTAPHRFGWDYNRAYDLMEMAGVSHPMQRCSPAFGEEPLQKLWTYSQCFPDVWEKMVDRVPGVGAAARYARTELYSFHGRPEKPAGMLWNDFLRHYLLQHNLQERQIIADRLADIIRRHYRKTTDPIVVAAAHPESGVSWNFLLMIAMRGDFKQRKQAGGQLPTDENGRPHPRLWTRYLSELQDILNADSFGELCYPGPKPATAAELTPDYAKEAMADAVAE